jgi:uncharacterized circularly permuted ATP-grasp superfamily protein
MLAESSSLRPYAAGPRFDEYFTSRDAFSYECAANLLEHVRQHSLPQTILDLRNAERVLLTAGVDYRLERPMLTHPEAFLPFDPLPRLIDQVEWDRLEAGLTQRTVALDAFVADLYGEQRILRDGLIPEDLIASSPFWRPELVGYGSEARRWCVLAAFDLIRAAHGHWMVLEENLRRASGIGYALAAREAQRQHFQWLFEGIHVAPIQSGPSLLRSALASLAPWTEEPDLVVLTPGRLSSAFYEHRRLADEMEIPVVEPTELWVDAGRLWRHSGEGPVSVDVIYRRNEDFYPSDYEGADHMLGIPGLMGLFLNGSIAIANPPGTGIAGDKLVYSFMPDVIRYYLGEQPKIEQVPTYRCVNASEREYVLDRLDQLVIKQVGGAGGAGVLIGPLATPEERLAMAQAIGKNPRHHIAQPLQELSTVPCLRSGKLEPCRVDLRPIVVFGRQPVLATAALTRVALQPTSRIVNFTQGGGFKDTWIVRSDQ